MEENEKIFIKKTRERVKELIILFFEDENEDDIKFNELKSYCDFLISNQMMSNNNKIIYSQIFIETSFDYLKNWFVEFLTNSIFKIYKKELKDDLLNSNQYFTFKFLANKEIIKILLNKYIKIINYYYLITYYKIYSLEEANTSFSHKNEVIEYMYTILKKYSNEKININLDIRTLNIFPFFFDFKRKMINNQDLFIESLNDKNIFEKNDNDEIIVSDSFIDFAEFYFNIKINKTNFISTFSDKENIKEQINENISLLSF